MKIKKILSVAGLSVLTTYSSFASDDLAKEAYIYAYSMDEAYKYFYETSVEPDYPLNRFQTIRGLADHTYVSHPTINNDTLHLMGWLDVAAEPVIVSVPDMDEGRYWILHTMDLGHYTNGMFGSRTLKNKGGQFMFVSKSWEGEVPESVDEVVKTDSDIVKLMGRIMVHQNPEDERIALDYMDQWNIRTLSEYLGQNGPKPLERKYPNPKNTSWLERVNFVLCDGSLAKADEFWLPKYKEVGLEACKYDFTEEQLKAADKAQEEGLKHIVELSPSMSDSRKLLGTRKDLGTAPRDEFSVGTYIGQWGLPPVEASYRKTQLDVDGDLLDGSKHEYIMKFPAPDVSEFWSITIYGNESRLMEENALNRHSRGDRTLTADKEGLYTIIMSSDAEKYKDQDNFLPIPKKPFYPVMRLYGPSEEIQSGEYLMPDVQKLDKK